MTIQLPSLPYALDALQPFLSEKTLQFHYGKHHKAYVDKLNTLIQNTPYASSSLTDIIKSATPGGVFNNAAQVWNHTFYWYGMTPNENQPTSILKNALDKDFGSLESFYEQFKTAALSTFGSGWVWLVRTPQEKLAIVSTSNAENPLTTDNQPLLTCDVWEHAYYLDTQNNRGQYVDNFFKKINWAFVERNLNHDLTAFEKQALS